MNFTWLNSFFGSHNLKSEMEEQANDLVTDKCQASDKITAIEVTSENSDIKQALLPGASDVSVVPQEIQSQLDENNKIVNAFYKAFGGSSEDWIHPLLEDWFFFNAFILRIPSLRATKVSDLPAYLSKYYPRRCHKGTDKKKTVTQTEFLQHLSFFWDISLHPDLSFVLKESDSLSGFGVFSRDSKPKETILVDQIVGIAFQLTGDIAANFFRMPKELQKGFLVQSVDGEGKFHIVIGPAQFVNNGCSSRFEPFLGNRNACKFSSEIKPKFTAQSLSFYCMIEINGSASSSKAESDEFTVRYNPASISVPKRNSCNCDSCCVKPGNDLFAFSKCESSEHIESICI